MGPTLSYSLIWVAFDSFPKSKRASPAMKPRARVRGRVPMTILFGSTLHVAYPWIPEAGTLSQASLHPFPEHLSILLCTCIEHFSSCLQHLRWTCSCCCQVASVVSNSVRPQRQQPTRLPCPWDSPGKNTGVGCHFLLQCMKVKVRLLSRVWLFAIPWNAAHQAPGSSIHGIFQARVLEWGAIEHELLFIKGLLKIIMLSFF